MSAILNSLELPTPSVVAGKGSLRLIGLQCATTERDVEGRDITRFSPAELDQCLFGCEQLALGVEHFNIVCDAFAITGAGKVSDLALGLGRAYLGSDLFGQPRIGWIKRLSI